VRAFFFFFFFIFINRGWRLNRLGKSLIYRDLNAEAVAKTASINAFRPPRLIFCVVAWRQGITIEGIDIKLHVHCPQSTPCSSRGKEHHHRRCMSSITKLHTKS
jgi:hypothetical protein